MRKNSKRKTEKESQEENYEFKYESKGKYYYYYYSPSKNENINFFSYFCVLMYDIQKGTVTIVKLVPTWQKIDGTSSASFFLCL
jgi:hypothetical protein